MSLRRSGPFTAQRGRRGGVTVRLAPHERELLAGLLTDVAELLADDDPAPSAPGASAARPPEKDPQPDDAWQQLVASLRVEPPSDPAVARLLPPGHQDDDDLAQSYRRLTEQSLRETKRAGLARAEAALRREQDPVVLDAGEAADLLKGLTDVRLVLAERIGLHTDEDAAALPTQLTLLALRVDGEGRLDDEEARWAHLATVYEALTWWQEELVGALR